MNSSNKTALIPSRCTRCSFQLSGCFIKVSMRFVEFNDTQIQNDSGWYCVVIRSDLSVVSPYPYFSADSRFN